MTQEELQFIMKLQDEASQTIKKIGDALKGLGGGASTVKKEADEASKSLDNLVTQAKAAGAAIAGAFASNKMLNNAITTFAGYEKGLINVRKTTDMTIKEIREFEREFDKLLMTMTGVRPDEMLNIAGAIGQMGVHDPQDILKMTEVMGKLSIAAPTVSGEQGASTISRILTVTGEGIKNVEKFASALVHLGNTTAATEHEILSMASRIAQSTAQFGLTSDAILGIAAAAKQLDFRPELFGTAMGRLFTGLTDSAINATKGMERLTRLTGITREQFLQILEDKPEQAFLIVLKVFKDLRDAGMSTTQFMRDLRLEGIEIASVLGSASKNIELFDKKMVESAREYEEIKALTEEYMKAIEGLSARWDGLTATATVFSKTIGGALAPILKPMVDWVRELMNMAIRTFTALPGPIQTVIALIGTLSTTILGIGAALSIVGRVGAFTAVVKGFTTATAVALRFSGVLLALRGTMVALSAIWAVMWMPAGAAIAGVITGIKAVGTAFKAMGAMALLMSRQVIAAMIRLGAVVLATSGAAITAVRNFSLFAVGVAAVRKLTAAFVLLRVAILSIPLAIAAIPALLASLPVIVPVAIGAAMVALGALIYSKWDEIKAFFSQSWSEIGEGMKTAISNAWDATIDYLKDGWNRFVNWLAGDDVAAALEEAEKAATTGSQSVAGAIETNIGKGLSEKAFNTLDDMFNFREARRIIKDQKDALEELLSLDVEVQVQSGFEDKDIRRLKAMIKQAERELDPLQIKIDDLTDELETARAITKDRQNTLEVDRAIRDIRRDIIDLTEEEEAQVRKIIRARQQAEQDKAYEDMIRTLRRGLEDARALTEERKTELMILRQIEDAERDIGSLTRERKNEIAQLIAQTRQLELFRALEEQLDPITAAVREYEQGVRTLNDAFASGLISAERYYWLLQRLNDTTLTSRNPILERVRTMREELALFGLRGKELEIERTVQQEINSLRSQGVPITRELTQAVREYATALAEANEQGKSGIRQWLDEIGTFEEAIEKLKKDTIGGLADALTEAFTGGKDALRNFGLQLGKMMVRFAVENTMRQLFQPFAQQQKQDSATRIENAISKIESLAQSGIHTPQAVVNAGQVSINGQPFGWPGAQDQSAYAAPVSPVERAPLPANTNMAPTTGAAPGSFRAAQEAGLTLKQTADQMTTAGNQMTQALSSATQKINSAFNTAGPGSLSIPDLTSTAQTALDKVTQAVSNATSSAVDTVTAFLGMHERTNRSQINSFLKAGGIDIDAAQTAWCAAFVNSALEQVGVTGSGSLVAADFLKWGQAVRPEDVLRGDVLVAHRGRQPGQTGAHVGFATGNTRMGPNGLQLEMLSGNESNRVQTSWYDANQLAIRRATEDMQKLGQQTQQTVQQMNQQFQQQGMTMQTAHQQVQQSATTASQAMQMSGQNMQQLGYSTQNVGQQASQAAPQIDQAGTALQNAGMRAQQAGQQASNANPGFSAMQNGIRGLLGPLDQVVPGLGSFAQAVLQLIQQLMSGIGGGGLFGGILGFLFHSGGVVGRTSATRAMPITAWAGAPRFHKGLFKKDEYPAILKRGERVLTESQNKKNLAIIDGLSRQVEEMGKVLQFSRNGGRRYGEVNQTVVNNINVRDANGFRKSEGQIFADTLIKMQRMAVRNN